MEPGSEGVRLDRFLTQRIRRLTRTRASRLTVVDLDDPNRNLKKSSMVHAGQRLWVRRPIPDANVEPPELDVIYEDRDLLILDKPAGIAIHPTATRFVGTVTHWLKRTFPDAEPAHRLDVETSGILVCGRHAFATRGLQQLFAARGARKLYRAVVEGLPTDEHWVVDRPLGFTTDSEIRLKMGHGDAPAETRFSVVRHGRQRTLVEARPISGRQHQIRVHAAMSGHPLVGDKLYGPDEQYFLRHLDGALEPADWRSLGHSRHALHAASIELTWKGVPRRFEAPWPSSLDALVI